MYMIPEPTEPEYFLNTFPRDAFPAYNWTERTTTLPGAAWTTETTHRDGQQGGLPLSSEQSLKIYDILCRFTANSGAIRQAESFVYRPSDRAALEGVLERYRGGSPIEPTTWIRATSKDVALIRTLGIRETGMLASASDYHTFHKFKPGGRNQAAQIYLEALKMTLDAGIRPRLHLEDATRAPMDFLLPFIENVQEISATYGPELRPKFRICDTMGLGLPFDDVALPRSIPRIFHQRHSPRQRGTNGQRPSRSHTDASYRDGLLLRRTARFHSPERACGPLRRDGGADRLEVPALWT